MLTCWLDNIYKASAVHEKDGSSSPGAGLYQLLPLKALWTFLDCQSHLRRKRSLCRDLLYRRGLHILVLLLASFPIIAVGQERAPQIQVKTAEDHLPQSRSATIEEGQSAVSITIFGMSEEGADPRLWNMDMGGVNPFRLPEPRIQSFRTFSPGALIGPVWKSWYCRAA